MEIDETTKPSKAMEEISSSIWTNDLNSNGSNSDSLRAANTQLTESMMKNFGTLTITGIDSTGKSSLTQRAIEAYKDSLGNSASGDSKKDGGDKTPGFTEFSY